ncbi:hypothetical protein [Siminovitchia fordii]|uniref:Single-stranded DNA-binding protein n=1 Tax=Siminovitchia fordii TaxID=254759 RepID=A0ABQ4KCE2_9BACI|nr:hypothetical protein [Siminovitchia fordii]GIN22543.1 hypothetical protein J1TS3_36770 [Siminovitchia fordii]
MTEQNVLREAENSVDVEGLLLEVRHTEWKSGEGLNIELDIEVSDNEVHTVSGMTRYKKKDGSDNSIASGYQTIIDTYKSVATHGRDEADQIRVSGGKIGLNEYYGQDDKLRSFPQISSNFFNRVQPGEEFEPKAEFSTELYVRATREETDSEGNETGRAILEGYIPLYGGKVIPFTFVVSEEGSEYVMDNYEPGNTVYIYGDIVNYKEKIVKKTKAAFGKDKETITYKTVREYVVTGGEDPYDEDDVKVYDGELIKKALVERETYLEELKNNRKNNNDTKKENKKGGFGKGKKEKSKKEFDPDSLPF